MTPSTARVPPYLVVRCRATGSGNRLVVTSTLSGFALSVEYLGARVELGVRGELDIATAPDLGVVVDALIDRGHRFVVLDLAELEFMDASGLRVIARAVHRLAPADGALIIRSPRAIVRRILDVTGLIDIVRLEQPEPALGRDGPGSPVGPSASPVLIEGDALADQLRRITDLHAVNNVVDSVLRVVVALARATVGGADGVSVSLRRQGHLATVAASDQTITEMDSHQYAVGQGPCVDASVEGRWFHVDSLDLETRWPAFRPRAQALGINAILASPLHDRDRPVGALNIYSRTSGAFTPQDQRLAEMFATEASSVLTRAGTDVTTEQLVERILAALTPRQVIAMAQGVIMERNGVGGPGAYDALRRGSVENGRTLWQQAEDVVASTRATPGGYSSDPDRCHDG